MGGAFDLEEGGGLFMRPSKHSTGRPHAPRVSIASASLKMPMFPSSFPAMCTDMDEPFISAWGGWWWW